MPRLLAVSSALAMCAFDVFMPTTGRADDSQQVLNANFSISRAIAAAETKGMGKATEAEFDGDTGRWRVMIFTDKSAKLTNYFVDRDLGEIADAKEQTTEKYWTKLKSEVFQKAPIQLREAVDAAELAAKGKAISAKVERSSETVTYEVDVETTHDYVQEVKVNAQGIAMMR